MTREPKLDEIEDHYRFRVSLRLRHPGLDPQVITDNLTISPKWMWQAGLQRFTPTGLPLDGFYKETYWIAHVAEDNYLTRPLNEAIYDVLSTLVKHKEFFYKIRPENGSVELFIGWFFNRQSGDVLFWPTLALASDLQIDLSLHVYSPDQP